MDIEELKEEIRVDDVLAHYGADTWKASYHGRGWTPINCPFCGDTNGSASVNIGAGLFLCHQCSEPRDGKAGDIVNIVMSQEGLDVPGAIEFLKREFL